MEVKSKVFKRKSGKSKNKWVVRIEYFDELTGRKRCMERHAEKKGDATDLRNKLIADVKKSRGQIQTGERMTFSQLVTLCEEAFYKPAVIVEGRKVAGVRSIETVKLQMQTLNKYFGKRLIKNLTTESLFDFKLWRLKTDSKQLRRPVKISTVNRELTTMGKMMRFAYGKGWVTKDIFFNSKVIDTSGEMERNRILTLSEEKRLLEACGGKREITYKRKFKGEEQEVNATISVDNPHLKAMIVLAIDSGLRRGEILKLRWSDFDFENNAGKNIKSAYLCLLFL
jgi:integrase